MARYIDAKKLIEHLKDNLRECENPDVATQPISYGCSLGLKGALSYAETLPTAEVEEVRHGEWIGKPIAGYSTVMCSGCKNLFRENNGKWKYCPNCGARMDGKKVTG